MNFVEETPIFEYKGFTCSPPCPLWSSEDIFGMMKIQLSYQVKKNGTPEYTLVLDAYDVISLEDFKLWVDLGTPHISSLAELRTALIQAWSEE